MTLTLTPALTWPGESILTRPLAELEVYSLWGGGHSGQGSYTLRKLKQPLVAQRAVPGEAEDRGCLSLVGAKVVQVLGPIIDHT